jgi:predicted phage-related endonuclease
MIILDMEQRSDEWFAARRGRPTASNAGKIITSTGKKSTQWKGYMYELVAERAGHQSPPFEPTEAMLEGIRREEESRDAYSFITGHAVKEVGMIVCKATGASCSPDGLALECDPPHGLELKNPKPGTFFAELDNGKVPSTYLPQIHMSMAVSGLELWDYGCYLPGQEMIIHEVRADNFTALVSEALAEFCCKLDETCRRLGVPTLEEMS